MSKKVLTLRICSQGFKDLVDGKIKYRYRELKPYWEKRLLQKDGTPKVFDEIHIKNGYKTDSPLAIIEFGGNMGVFNHEGKPHFKLKLGKIKQILNYEK